MTTKIQITLSAEHLDALHHKMQLLGPYINGCRWPLIDFDNPNYCDSLVIDFVKAVFDFKKNKNKSQEIKIERIEE